MGWCGRPGNKMISNNKGFSLIELSIALIVIGLMTGTAIELYRLQQKQRFLDNNANSFAILDRVMKDFYFENNRYPCPADLTKSTADDDYGEEDCTSANPVLIGGVPFKNLKIPASVALDSWSHKITYAVTKAQTVAPLTAPGAITVLELDRLDSTIVNTFPNIHLVFVSHGEDAFGAFSAEGVPVEPCAAVPTRESENCDGDNTFFLSSNRARSYASDNTLYDDQTPTTHWDSLPARIWAYSGVDSNDIFSNPSYVIGVGNRDPDQNISLDVNGDVRATGATPGNGTADISQLCTVDGNNCFASEVIAGAGIKCDLASDPSKSLLMSGIAHADTLCADNDLAARISAGMLTGTCPAGKYVMGIDAGGIICTP